MAWNEVGSAQSRLFNTFVWIQRFIATLLCLQTAELGLDIGAQGEPLAYRQEGKLK